MQNQPAQTIRDLLGRGADAAVAIAAPEHPAMTHGGLRALADRTAQTLAELGNGRGDRVALVMPNGPEAATSFARIATAAATAPDMRRRGAHIPRAALALGPDDCCLNVLPLFHIHGLIAAVLSSLAAGGSVFGTPGFDVFVAEIPKGATVKLQRVGLAARLGL